MRQIHEIENFISIIRDSVPNAVEVYTRGNCTSFARILEITFPGGRVMHNISHACYKYAGLCYDITGNIKEPKNSRPIEDFGIRQIMTLTKNNYK